MTAKRALYWSIPSLVCLALYWYGLKAWFQMDDFAWLSLHRLVHDFNSFVEAMFSPMAQGTVRPLSERLFFLAFWQLFGMDALPYRALVFGTQFLNLGLITIITRRLTGSAAAGFVAPILWLVSPILYEPMVWTSAYNQILCAFFLLLAFYLLLQWVESGAKRYYAGVWITFLLGFGALEVNVVFPALAAVYLMLFARKRLLAITPMFLVSIAYTVLHRNAARGHETETYVMSFRADSVLAVFWKYIEMSFSAYPMALVSNVSKTQLLAAGAFALVALLLFAVVMLRKRNWVVLFFLAWYVITLAPYLPLVNHVSDYYLSVPMIGLAMLGGWGLNVAWRSGWPARAIAITAVLLFAIPGAWQARYMTRRASDSSRRVRHLVRSIAAAHKIHPNKTIVLKGVDNDLFWNGVYDRPQLALGWTGLYVTNDTQQVLIGSFDRNDIADRLLPDAVTLEAIRKGSAVVYDASEGRLRNITTTYGRVLALDPNLPLPSLIDAGNPLYSKFLKEGWYPPSKGRAWTERSATVELRGPSAARGKLLLRAVLSPRHTQDGPITVSASVDGSLLGSRPIALGQTSCDLSFDLPDTLVGQHAMRVTIMVDRTVVSPPDTRAVGLLFGTIEVTP